MAHAACLHGSYTWTCTGRAHPHAFFWFAMCTNANARHTRMCATHVWYRRTLKIQLVHTQNGGWATSPDELHPWCHGERFEEGLVGQRTWPPPPPPSAPRRGQPSSDRRRTLHSITRQRQSRVRACPEQNSDVIIWPRVGECMYHGSGKLALC
jgi:hypothetical protein